METNKIIAGLKKYAPEILSIVGGLGVIFTAVESAKNTPKALKAIEEKEREERQELTTLEKVKTAAKYYIPTMLVGGATIGCIVGSELLNKKQQKDLSGMLALVSVSYQTYQTKNESLPIPEKGDIPSRKVVFSEEEDDDYILVYDGVFHTDANGGSYLYRVKPSGLINALYEANKEYYLYGATSAFDFYVNAGVNKDIIPKEFENIGWPGDQHEEFEAFEGSGACWINLYYSLIGTTLEDGIEVTNLFFNVMPVAF